MGTDGAKESWLGQAEVAWRDLLPYSLRAPVHGCHVVMQDHSHCQGPEVGTAGCPVVVPTPGVCSQ